MDVLNFVHNVKSICKSKNISPTVACKESGAGKSLMSQMEKHNSIPSVEKVQLLAQYLGVTTSELLGETTGEELPPKSETPTPVAGDRPDILVRFNSLSPGAQKEVIAFIEFKRTQELGGQHE